MPHIVADHQSDFLQKLPRSATYGPLLVIGSLLQFRVVRIQLCDVDALKYDRKKTLVALGNDVANNDSGVSTKEFRLTGRFLATKVVPELKNSANEIILTLAHQRYSQFSDALNVAFNVAVADVSHFSDRLDGLFSARLDLDGLEESVHNEFPLVVYCKIIGCGRDSMQQ